jgi:type II secretory pathway component PulJ
MIRSLFSLVEALVSLVLMAFVLSSVSFILIDTQKAGQDLWEKTQLTNSMAVILESLREDLSELYLPSSDDTDTVFFPTNISEGEERMDGVAFKVRQQGENGQHLAEVEYLCSPNEENEGFHLYRRYSPESDEDLHDGGIYERLIGPLASFSIDYGLSEGWTSAPENLPIAMTVKMVHMEHPQAYHATFLLPHLKAGREEP